MGRLADGLSKEVLALFESDWQPDWGGMLGTAPGPATSKRVRAQEGTVLCAELAEAAELARFFQWWFAAEVHQAYLGCAGRIIRGNGGEVLSCQSERLLALFEGADRDTAAARAALQINYAARRIIMPAILSHHPRTLYVLRHACGVDRGLVYACRGWMDGGAESHWLGLPVSQASQLCALREDGYATYLTVPVHEALHDSVRYAASGLPLWQGQDWEGQGVRVYRSLREEVPRRVAGSASSDGGRLPLPRPGKG